jgi:hypothetical protein
VLAKEGVEPHDDVFANLERLLLPSDFVGRERTDESSSSSSLSFELFRINDDAQELQIDIGT